MHERADRHCLTFPGTGERPPVAGEGTPRRLAPTSDVHLSAQRVKAPLDVVMLATTLETVATETYLNNLGLLNDDNTAALFAVPSRLLRSPMAAAAPRFRAVPCHPPLHEDARERGQGQDQDPGPALRFHGGGTGI